MAILVDLRAMPVPRLRCAARINKFKYPLTRREKGTRFDYRTVSSYEFPPRGVVCTFFIHLGTEWEPQWRILELGVTDFLQLDASDRQICRRG